MEMNEMRQRLTEAEQSIHRVAAVCQQHGSVPEPLQECIRQMEEHSTLHRQLLQTSQDEIAVCEYIEKLEELGDRTKQVCEQAGNVSPELRDAVLHAHEELSNLKHQLH